MVDDSEVPQAFLSYARADNDYLDGGIAWLCDELQRAMRAITGEPFSIFRDEDGIGFGQHWPSRIEEALLGARFLIPILTPSYFKSKACRDEAMFFLAMQERQDRRDLILPIYLIDADVLEDPTLRSRDDIARQFYECQYADWRDAAFKLRSTPRTKQRIRDLANQIKAASARLAGDAPPTVPAQGPGVRFGLNRDGKIDRIPDEPHDADENDPRLMSLQSGLITACDQLLSSLGHNAFGFLAEAVEGYRSAIDQPMSSIQYTDIWRLGQRLQNIANAATRDIDRLEPSLEDRQQAALDDVLVLHGPFILSTTEGRILQTMSERYRATKQQQEDYKEAALAFRDAIEAVDFISDEAKEIVSEASEGIGQGQFPEQQIITLATANQNILSAAGKATVASVVLSEDSQTRNFEELAASRLERLDENDIRQLVREELSSSTIDSKKRFSKVGTATAFLGGSAAAGLIENAVAGSALGKELIKAAIEAINSAGHGAMQFLLSHEMLLKGLAASNTGNLSWLPNLIHWLRLQTRLTPRTIKALPSARQLDSTKKTLPAPGRAFRDIDESWCPEMVVIPAGDFMMGSPKDETGRSDNEEPRHRRIIEKPFALGRYPVTFDEFDFFCAEIGREKPEDRKNWGRGKRPAIYVSWLDAKAYCDWLSVRTKRDYRLPSETEWEYACRAGTATAYAFGENIQGQEANFNYNIGKTTIVGAYAPNSFDLYDMHGNILEWCSDVYQDSNAFVPTNNSRLVMPHVVRGGSWKDNVRRVRSASRDADVPNYKNDDVGFRCARVLE